MIYTSVTFMVKFSFWMERHHKCPLPKRESRGGSPKVSPSPTPDLEIKELPETKRDAKPDYGKDDFRMVLCGIMHHE